MDGLDDDHALTGKERKAAERAAAQRRSMELMRAYDEVIRHLMQAKYAAIRYLESQGGLSNFHALAESDLEEAKAAIDDIQDQLMNL